MIHDEYRALQQEAATRPDDVGAHVRLAHRASIDGREEALSLWSDLLARDPNSTEIREGYLRAGGFWAQLVDDKVLGESLFVSLPNYEGRRENVVLGLGNLEGGRRDWIDNWLNDYEGREDGVIVAPARLETAVACGLFAIRDFTFFASPVNSYRSSFQAAVEDARPGYGKLTYRGDDTMVTLDELALDRRRVARTVEIPYFTDNYGPLALSSHLKIKLARKEVSQVRKAMEEFRAAQECVAALLGQSNPARAFQHWASQRSRNVALFSPSATGRCLVSERTLYLGGHNGSFLVNASGGNGRYSTSKRARGCRRAEKLPWD